MRKVKTNFFVLLVLCVASGVKSYINPAEEVQNMILDLINEPAPNFAPCNKDLLQKATFGDMIEIKRSGYFHWCVFFRGETVIHFDNPDFDRLTFENAFDNFTGQVKCTNLIQLAKEDFCRINNKVSESKRRGLTALPKLDILKQMNEAIKHNIMFYNLVDNNCEHFAVKLRFGVPFSSQIEAARKIVPKEDWKKTVKQMFEIAAILNYTHTSESFSDVHSVSVIR